MRGRRSFAAPDPIQDRIEGYPPTHFELKYREEGRPLHFMRFRRQRRS